MKRFIDENRGVYGVEPICKVLPIAPSTYYAQRAREVNPDKQNRHHIGANALAARR